MRWWFPLKQSRKLDIIHPEASHVMDRPLVDMARQNDSESPLGAIFIMRTAVLQHVTKCVNVCVMVTFIVLSYINFRITIFSQ